MSRLKWDDTGNRFYETGVDQGVLYVMSDSGYENGVAWNGLSDVKESPSGGEPKALWANNSKYAVLVSAEELGLTLEAFTYPKEFGVCDGEADLAAGITINNQNRSHFGFCYRTLLGNDVKGTDYGYKIHIVYDCLAAPSEKDRKTVNDSSDVSPFSWSVSTTPVPVENHKPCSKLTIDSTTVNKEKMKKIEDALYGDRSAEPKLLMPSEILTILSGE